MTESMKYYESIRRKYPETVSKDQFYQIAHISKATALHLLQNGLVPCKDTGKKTRRYTIRTDDNHVAGFVHKALQRKDAVPADKIISVHIRHLAL